MSNTHLSEIRFSELDIHPDVQKGIESAGFEFCTPVQALTLPVALKGKDVSGQAQTGTGKTAAFLIATINRLLMQPAPEQDNKNSIRALILAPTRELAIQIHEDGKPLIKNTPLKMALAYGGTDYEKQSKKIEKGADILIGTPGRVIDFFKKNVFSMHALQVIVLDEADRMFDLGFISDIRFLMRRMPESKERLNLLFSATLSHRVNELAYEHMNEPEIIKIEAESITAERIKEVAYMPSNEDKIPLLLGILKETEQQRTVVFVNTKHVAETIQIWLESNGFKSALLSGDVPQKKRESLLNKFKKGECHILVATDVAARGLHISDVYYVVNFDLPTDAEDYVHRIGRTARAGASGTAISMVCETYAMSLLDIESYIEHALPIEKNYADKLYQDPVTPSKEAMNARFSNRRNKPANKKETSKPKKSDYKQATKFKKEELSPESKDANAPVKQVAQNKRHRVTPLRGRRAIDVPAVG